MLKPNNNNNNDNLNGMLFLNGEINNDSAKSIIKEIVKLNQKNELDYIQLLINSQGGYTSSGFAIIDIMLWSEIPIYTTGFGLIASMGLLIFMAGEKGYRVISPRTSILSHRFNAQISGSHSKLLAFRKEEDLMHTRIVDHYLEYSNLKSQKEIETLLLQDYDVWLTADEAVKYGLADIIENKKKKNQRYYEGENV